MSSEWILGALALVTIGGILAVAVFHFGYHLKDPKNMAAAKAAALDRESAATSVSSEGADGRTLRQRLDEAPSIDDRLSNRPVGLSPTAALLSTSWSEFRGELTGERRPS